MLKKMCCSGRNEAAQTTTSSAHTVNVLEGLTLAQSLVQTKSESGFYIMVRVLRVRVRFDPKKLGGQLRGAEVRVPSTRSRSGLGGLHGERRKLLQRGPQPPAHFRALEIKFSLFRQYI